MRWARSARSPSTAEPADDDARAPCARRRAARGGGLRARPLALRRAAATSRGSTARRAPGSRSTRGSSRRSRLRCARERRRTGGSIPTILPALAAAGYDRSFELLDRAGRHAGSTAGMPARESTSTRARERRVSSAAPPSISAASARASPRRARSQAMRAAWPGADRARSSISAATSPSGARLPRAGRGAWTSQTRERPAASPERSSSQRGGVATSGRDTRRFGPGGRLHHLIDPGDRRAGRRRPALGHGRGRERHGGRGARDRARHHGRRRGTRPPRLATRPRSAAHPPRRRADRHRPPSPGSRAPASTVRHHHADRTVLMALKAHTHAVARRRAALLAAAALVAVARDRLRRQRRQQRGRRQPVGRRLHPPGHDAVLARPVRPALGHAPSRPTRPSSAAPATWRARATRAST